MMGDKAGHGMMFTGTVQQEPQQCLRLCDRSTVKSKAFFFFFIEAIPLCDNISFLYVLSYTTIYIKITQLRVTV